MSDLSCSYRSVTVPSVDGEFWFQRLWQATNCGIRLFLQQFASFRSQNTPHCRHFWWLVIGQLEYIHYLPSNRSILAQFTIKLDNILFCVCLCVCIGDCAFCERERERERKGMDQINTVWQADRLFRSTCVVTSRWIVQVQNLVIFWSPRLRRCWSKCDCMTCVVMCVIGLLSVGDL